MKTLAVLAVCALAAHAQTAINGSRDAQAAWQFSGDLSPSQITADQNNYNPTGLSSSSTLRLNSDASRNITGLAGGADGRILLVHNVGAQNIVLVDESASSTAANRFALTANVTLAADSVVLLQYDSTSQRWRTLSGGGAGGGATTALDNLASVNINASLLFQSGKDIGSTANPAQNLYLYGQGTYGTNYFKFDGTPTGTRTITFPDATGTVPYGTGTNTNLAYWSGTNSLTADANLTWSGTQLLATRNVAGSATGVVRVANTHSLGINDAASYQLGLQGLADGRLEMKYHNYSGLGGSAEQWFGLHNGNSPFLYYSNGREFGFGIDAYASNNAGPGFLFHDATAGQASKVMMQQGATQGTTHMLDFLDTSRNVMNGFDFRGRPVVVTNASTTVGTCGTSPSIVGNDFAGIVTVGTGTITSCVVTFANAYANAPVCTASDATTVQAVQASATTSALTLTVTTDFHSENVNYICIGR